MMTIEQIRDLYDRDPLNENARLWDMWYGGDGEASDDALLSWYNSKYGAITTANNVQMSLKGVLSPKPLNNPGGYYYEQE